MSLIRGCEFLRAFHPIVHFPYKATTNNPTPLLLSDKSSWCPNQLPTCLRSSHWRWSSDVNKSNCAKLSRNANRFWKKRLYQIKSLSVYSQAEKYRSQVESCYCFIFPSCHCRMNYIWTYYITLKKTILWSGEALSKSSNNTYWYLHLMGEDLAPDISACEQ